MTNTSKSKLRLIRDDGVGKDVWIFVHGYSAAGSEKKRTLLMENIRRTSFRGRAYLYVWDSGSWQNAGVLHAVVRAVNQLQKFWRANGWTWILEAAYYLLHFKYYERRAGKIGRDFDRHISEIPDILDSRIFFVGHSLGARLLQHALKYGEFSEYNIEDVIMLGGAAELENDWDTSATKINGKLFNCYSTNDAILPLATVAGFSFKIGANPIESSNGKIKNLDFSPYGHTDYWKNWVHIKRRVQHARMKRRYTLKKRRSFWKSRRSYKKITNFNFSQFVREDYWRDWIKLMRKSEKVRVDQKRKVRAKLSPWSFLRLERTADTDRSDDI